MLREGLRLLERREQEDDARLALLCQRLDLAEEDVRLCRLDDYTPTLLDALDAEERAAYQSSETRSDGCG